MRNPFFKSIASSEISASETDQEAANARDIHKYLTSQITPFILDKFNSQTDAACASLKKVLSETNVKGLPPSLTAALTFYSREQFLQTALPYVFTTLSYTFKHRQNNDGQMVALTEAETELVKTMTVILSGDDGIRLPLATLQLFVVQFSPFFSKLNASESFLRMVLSDQIQISFWGSLSKANMPDLAVFNRPFMEIDRVRQTMSRGINSPLSCLDAAVLQSIDRKLVKCPESRLWCFSYLRKRLSSIFGQHPEGDTTRLIKSEPLQRRAVSITVPRSNSEDEEKNKHVRQKMKKQSISASPMSQCLIAQISTPWLVESFKNLATESPSPEASYRESGRSSRLTTKHCSPRSLTAHRRWTTVSLKRMHSRQTSIRQSLRRSVRRMSQNVRNLNRIGSRHLVPSGKGHSQATRFSIIDPAGDESLVIHSMLLYKKNGVKDDNRIEQRKWLSDSSVKYTTESGLYEKNFAFIFLDRTNLPKLDMLLSYFMQNFADLQPNMQLIETAVGLYCWLFEQVEHHNSDLENLIELGLILLMKLPCNCERQKNATNLNPFRGILLEKLDHIIHECEGESEQVLKRLIKSRPIEWILKMLHKVLETCRNFDNVKNHKLNRVQHAFLRTHMRDVILKIGEKFNEIGKNSLHTPGSLINYIRYQHPKVFCEIFFDILIQGKKDAIRIKKIRQIRDLSLKKQDSSRPAGHSPSDCSSSRNANDDAAESKSRNPSDCKAGVGRSMIRRLTEMVQNTKSDDNEKAPEIDQNKYPHLVPIHSSDALKLDLEKICEGIGILRTVLGLMNANSLPDGNFIAQIFNMDAPVFVRVVTLVELTQYVRQNLICLQRTYQSENSGFHQAHSEETRLELKNQFQNWAEKITSILEEPIADDQKKISMPTVSTFLTNKEIDKVASKRWIRNFGLILLSELVAFIREANLQASKAKCKKAQLHLPKRRGRHGPHYKNQDEDNDSLGGSRHAKNKLDILYTHGALGMKQFFSRWGFKDKDLPIELNSNIISNPSADLNEHSEPNRKSLNLKSLRGSSLDHTPKGPSQSYINLMGHFLSDFSFDCDHKNGECFMNCYVATRQVTETLGSLILLLLSDNYLDKIDCFAGNKKAIVQEAHQIIEKVPVACLSVLVESIHEISNATMQFAIYPCWKIITLRNDKASKLAAVFILLACHRLKETIPAFLKLCLEKDPPAELLEKMEILWNMRSHVWSHVDKRVARHFKLPSLAVNIALPNPPLGDYPEEAPDAPWMNEYNDFEKMYAEGILNADLLKSNPSSTKKSEQEKTFKKEQEEKQNKRQKYSLTNLSIQDSINQHYYRSVGSMDDEEEGSRRFSSRLMSITSMGTMVDENNLTDSGNDINNDNFDRSYHFKDDVPSQVFPTALQNILPKLFYLVDSPELHKNIPVNLIAKDLFKKFLTEDCFLLLRSVTEKIISRTQTSAEPVSKIYDLVLAIGGSKDSWNLSAQTTKTIANYVVGLMTMITRNGDELERHRMEQLILILQLVLPNIEGVTLKQLKATFKKENCKISLFSVVYGAKKLTCFGPYDHMIPNQIDVGSDVKFIDILEEGIEFYSLTASPGNVLCLQDRSKNRLLNPNTYVRDYFIFKKGEIPQVTIVEVAKARAEKDINSLAVNQFNDEIAKNEADLTTKEQLTPEILASLINSINASSTCGECYFLDKVSTKTLDTIYLSESENFQIFDALNLCQILILEWSDKTSITKMFLLLDILVDIELYEVRQQLKKFSKVSLLLFTKLKKVTEVVENIALQSQCFQSRTTMSKRGNRVTSDELDDESSESVEFNACTECVLPRQTYLQVVLKIYKVSKDRPELLRVLCELKISSSCASQLKPIKDELMKTLTQVGCCHVSMQTHLIQLKPEILYQIDQLHAGILDVKKDKELTGSTRKGSKRVDKNSRLSSIRSALPGLSRGTSVKRGLEHKTSQKSNLEGFTRPSFDELDGVQLSTMSLGFRPSSCKLKDETTSRRRHTRHNTVGNSLGDLEEHEKTAHLKKNPTTIF
ncbi:Oidioi.mRNA.OKI2018_I69.XSR.g15827.t1.cds [Oikopleura dioica]|uniref:Oidioi.mRNA.OKI2018_I69.XSR.g15827.t1.cds n=1 Tax=Oikopleura dioica TaxID=34765 RepID=A0ABN7SG01_OIKDI|nr:Oidioi.mRNA.OKI2018_I69.XSR.g15827.t1.cds [Oikopleura dioica]